MKNLLLLLIILAGPAYARKRLVWSADARYGNPEELVVKKQLNYPDFTVTLVKNSEAKEFRIFGKEVDQTLTITKGQKKITTKSGTFTLSITPSDKVIVRRN